MTILDHIVESKRKEVAAAKQRRPVEELKAAVERVDPARDFKAAVLAPSPCGVQLIAEIKKSSPSAGLIVADFDAARIARTYFDHGAAALSVLTDETYFQGRLDFILQVKQAVPLPVLRKDFLIEEYQVYESRVAGADAVLLIAEVLMAHRIAQLAPIARRLGMAVLIEVHSEQSLSAVLDTLGPPGADCYLLGINNRDLTAQQTDLSTTTRLASRLPAGAPFVAESGIATRRDVLAAQRAGACAILVGESLLRSKNVGQQIDTLLGR